MKIITKENFLTTKELDFLQNFESNLLSINLKITEQENKKNEVTCLWNTISNMNSITKSNFSNNDYSQEIIDISEKFSKNIEELNSLKALLIDINNDFIANKFESNLSERINTYFTAYEKTKGNITLNDAEVDNFVEKSTSLKTPKAESVYEVASDENIQNNNTLIISEEDNKVFLPYTVSEIKSYIEKYPKEYSSLRYVINREFILPLDYYTKHPSLARFREAYSLIRDREAKSVFDALKYALNIMFKYDLNPAIISACKTEEALNLYIECLENKDLSKFDLFKIEFKLNPLSVSKSKLDFSK